MCATSNNISKNVIEEGRLEDDSQADSCMLVKGVYFIQNHNITCNVRGFTYSLGTMLL